MYDKLVSDDSKALIFYISTITYHRAFKWGMFDFNIFTWKMRVGKNGLSAIHHHFITSFFTYTGNSGVIPVLTCFFQINESKPRMLCNRNGAISHCKLKWDLFRTSVTACTIDEDTFSAPFGTFYVTTEIWKEFFQKKSYTTLEWALPIFKLSFLNGSYSNGVCRALWALSFKV